MLYLIAAVLLFLPAWADPVTTTAGLRGDPDQALWFVAWPAYAITNGHSPVFTDFILYPSGVNLLWNASVTLPALLAAPITLIGGPILTYNVLLTVATALSCWTAFLACRSANASVVGAFMGGLLYGFSPFVTLHALGHLNIVMIFVPPLCLLLLGRLLEERRVLLSGLAIGSLLAVQLVIWHELVVSTAIGLVVLGVASIIGRTDKEDALRRIVRGGAAATFAFILLGALPVAYFLTGPQRPRGSLHDPGRFVLDVRNLVVPSRAQLFSPSGAEAISVERAGTFGEWNGYLGIPMLLLLAYITWRGRRDRRVIALVGSIAVVTLLAFDPSIHVGSRDVSLLRVIPIVNHLLPSRLMVIVFAFMALLIAHSIDAEWLRGTGRRVLIGGLLLTVVAWFPAVPFPRTSHPMPSFFRSGALNTIPRGSVALVFPSREGMVWQARSHMWFRSPAGRAFAPTTGLLRRTKEAVRNSEAGRALPSPAKQEKIRAELAKVDVETIVLGPMPRRQQVGALFAALAGKDPTVVDGVLLWKLSNP